MLTTAIAKNASSITKRRTSGLIAQDKELSERRNGQELEVNGLFKVYLDVANMSEECVGKPCTVCNKTIQSANYYCSRCKACICFYCGAEILREADVEYLKCPRCSARLK